MAEENQELPYAQFNKEEFGQIMSVFDNDIGAFAKNLTEVLNEEYEEPDFLTYEGLRRGTSPAFQLFPSLKDLPPEQRRLSDEDIIEFFAYDNEGNPIKGGTFLEGFGRDIIPQAASVPTFMGGFALGNQLVAGVPPTTPLTLAIRVGTPLALGTLSSIGGYTMGEKITDEIMGEEPPILPGHTASYEMGKTAAGATAWLPLPFLVPNKINFGVESAKIALGDKKTISSRIAGGIEKTVGGMGGAAKAAPGTTLLYEGLSGTGATLGAGGAEQMMPDSGLARLIGEFGGGITVPVLADLLTSRVKQAYQGSKALYRGVKEGNLTDKISVLKSAREGQVINYILDAIEEAGEDPQAIIEKLGSNEFSDILVDDAGNPIELTAALKSGSPALLTLEKSLEKLTTGVGKERASANTQATRAIRNTLKALFASEDPASIQEAAVLMESVFQSGLEKDLADAMKNLFDAFDAIGAPDARQAQLGANLQELMSQRLKGARLNEKKLWKSIDTNFEIDEFLDENGEVTDTPRFIEWMEPNLPETEEAADDMFSDIAPLIKFYQRKRRELGLTPSDGGDGTRPSMSTDLRKAYDQYQKYEDMFIGTPEGGILENVTKRVDSIEDVNEKLSYLRSQAASLRERAKNKEFDDNNQIRKLATAYDRLANLELTKSREPDTSILPDQDGSITATEIYDMYGLALAKGREAEAKGKTNSARLARGFAQALMQDLENFDTGDSAYNTARAYTKALNNAFTRSFAGDILKKDASGRFRMPPETVANTIFQSDAGYLRMKQLDQVGQFELTQALTNLSTSSGNPDLQKILNRAIKYSVDEDTGLTDTAKLHKWLRNNSKSLSAYPGVLKNVQSAIDTTASIRGTTESILRNIRAQAFNPDTGEVSVLALRKWMEKPENQDILSAMPALKADLENVQTVNLLLDETKEAQRDQLRELKSRVSFMDLLPGTTENPATATSKAISNNQKKPVASWNELFDVVDKAPEKWSADGVERTREEAFEGLRSAFIESAMVKSGGTSTTFSARTFFDTLFAPHPNSKNKISLADWMESKELMSKKQLQRLKDLSTELVKMETFVASGDMGLDELAETVGPMMDFYLRIAGSSVGSRMQALIPGDTGSGQLVAAGAGSKAFRQVYGKIFNQIPESLKMDVMTEMFRDPDLMATMLQKGRTERERNNIAGRLAEILSEKGFIAATTPVRRLAPGIVRETQEEVEESQVVPSLPPSNQRSDLMPQTVLPTNRTEVQPNRVAAPAPIVPPSNNASQPATRSRYAALFPNDPISGMIQPQQQGIGSLFG